MYLQNPQRVKINRTRSKHEYVMPMNNFHMLPTPASRTRMIRNIHYKQLIFPPSIKEEEEEEEDDDDDVPLALLAYKKKQGLVPDKLDTLFPLVQHIQTEQRKQDYYHYPTLLFDNHATEPPALYHSRNNSCSSLISSSSSIDSLPSTPQ